MDGGRELARYPHEITNLEIIVMSDQSENSQQSPANPSSEEKSRLPDSDQTTPGTSSTEEEMTRQPIGEGRFTDEHSISPDHAEPTDVTGTANDTYTDSEYIDVGGGD
jgi:hypothetical protein